MIEPMPIATLTRWVWLYVPGFAEAPALPEGVPWVKAREHNGVWVTVESDYALVRQHAPTHWLPGFANPGVVSAPSPTETKDE